MIFETTLALRRRVADAAGVQPGRVHVGPPLRAEMSNDAAVVLFLFRITPNADLRNTPRIPLPGSAPVTGDAPAVEALAVDLLYLITSFRPGGVGNAAAADPTELATLQGIIAGLHAAPLLTGSSLPGQEVRITPSGDQMEELGRLWSLFPDVAFRTSMIYLATPVFIEIGTAGRYPAVGERRLDAGLASEPPAMAGGAG